MEPVELLVSKEVDEKSLIARDVRVIIDSSHPGTKGGGFLHFEVMTLLAPVCLEVLEVHRAEVVEVNNQSLKSEHSNTGRHGLKMKVSCEEGYEFTDDPNEMIETVENEDEETTEITETTETPEESEVRLNWNTCSFKNSKCDSSNGSPPAKGWLLSGSEKIPVWVKINMECAESNISGLIIKSDGNLEQFKIVFIDLNGLIQQLNNPDPLPGTFNATSKKFSVPNGTQWFFLSFDEAVGVCQVRIDVYSSATITGVDLDGTEPGAGVGCWGPWTPSGCSSPCGPGSRTSRRSCSHPGACQGDHTRQEGCIGTCSSFPDGKPCVKNHLYTVLPRIGKEWRISHEIYPTSYPSGGSNTIHFFASETGPQDERNVVGSRIPSFTFRNFQKLSVFQLKVFYPINGVNTEEVLSLPELNQWTSIDISQRLEDTSYMYRIVINDIQVLEVENSEPREFSDVKVFVSSDWRKPVEGLVRNLFVEGLQQGNISN